MLKFKKSYTIRILYLCLIIVFFINSTAYSASLSDKFYLRAPINVDTYKDMSSVNDIVAYDLYANNIFNEIIRTNANIGSYLKSLKEVNKKLKKASIIRNFYKRIDLVLNYILPDVKKSALSNIYDMRIKKKASDEHLNYFFLREMGEINKKDRDFLGKWFGNFKFYASNMFTGRSPASLYSKNIINSEIKRDELSFGDASRALWIIEHLLYAAGIIETESLDDEIFAKTIRNMIGASLYKLKSLPEESIGKESMESAFNAMQIGYFFGLSYIVDDALDSDSIEQGNKDLMFSLITRFLKGEEVSYGDAPDKAIFKELINCFLELRSILPYNSNKRAYDSFLNLHIWQIKDADKDFKEIYNLNELYLPILQKSAFTRIISASLFDDVVPEKFLMHFFKYALFNQFLDDFRDFQKDIKNKTFTPFTYFYFNSESRVVSNPMLMFMKVTTYLIEELKDFPGAKELIFGRLSQSVKVLAKNCTTEQFEEFLNLFLHDYPDVRNEFSKMFSQHELIVDVEGDFLAKMGRIPKKLRNFSEDIKEKRKLIDSQITINREADTREHNAIRDAINFSLNGTGKRLRPIMALIMAENYEIEMHKILPLANAIELLHTSSLIFDDLPAQDNAKLRRGHPTAHVQFGEDVAQLAGISAIAESISQLSDLSNNFPAEKVNKVIRYFGEKLGYKGMSYGQLEDLKLPFNKPTIESLEEISYLKTGLAIELSLVPVAMLAGSSEKEIQALKDFSYHFGIAFQIQDDILDVVKKDSDEIGKDTGIDQKNGKQTFALLLGVKKAKYLLKEHKVEAFRALCKISGNKWKLTVLLNTLLRHADSPDVSIAEQSQTEKKLPEILAFTASRNNL